MSCSFRQTLVTSHVGIATIAILLFRALEVGFESLLGPFYEITSFVLSTVMIGDIPYQLFSQLDRFRMWISLVDLGIAVCYFLAARGLSLWIYGEPPIRALRSYRARLTGEGNA
jgi:hypothetical protein